MACRESDISVFEDDLDDVQLTNEEYLLVKLPGHSVEQLSNSVGEFHFACSGSSDSSPDSENEHLHEERIYKNLRSACLETYTLSTLSGYAAHEWNNHPVIVYDALKVKTHIVKPNKFLSASSAGDSEERSYLDMDYIFGVISENKLSTFPSWENVLCEIEKLLPVFYGFKDLNDKLQVYKKSSGRCEALKMLHRLHMQMRDTLNTCPDVRPVIEPLKLFIQDLIKAVHSGSILEALSQTYIFRLIQCFQHFTNLHISCREKNTVVLPLPTKTGVKAMEVGTDLQVEYCGTTFLVGEVKRLSAIIPEESSKKDKECANVVSSSAANHSNLGQTEGGADAEEGNELKLSCVATDDETAEPQGHDGQVTSKTEATDSDFRPLNVVEAVKVNLYLPQLIAEMLACMGSNQLQDVHIGGDKERVQLGFAMEGFKLRFVRLVLRSTDQSFKPSVSNLKDRNVKCDVYLTKEFNLFNPKHLKMFFQFLYAISYTYI